MRTMLTVSIPVEAGNKAIKDGSLPKAMSDFVDRMKPEASYFTAVDGRRTAYFVFDMTDSSMIPSIAEPFFINLEASITLRPVMNLAEMKQGVEKAMKHR